MIIHTDKERTDLRASGRILGRALRELCAMAAEGMPTSELDLAAERMIRAEGGTPTFLNYSPEGAPYPFPAALCISINDEVVHGIPSEERMLRKGDVVSLDLGVTYEGLITDAARTIVIGGEKTADTERLISGAEEALKEAIKLVRAGARTGDIGARVAAIAKKYRLGIVRELGGHGVGHTLHEKPFVPNYGAPRKGAEFQENMVVALEPIFTLGSADVFIEADGYTYRTRDASLAAHVEDTVLITKNGAEILTR